MPKINKNTLFSLLILSSISLLFIYHSGQAQNLSNAQSYLTTTGAGIGYQTDVEPETLIGSIIQVALSLIGVFFLILIIVGGYQWMTAGGNEETIGNAKKRIINAIIGLAVVLGAYALSYFIIYYLSKNTIDSGI